MVKRKTILLVGGLVLCIGLLGGPIVAAGEPQYVAVWAESVWVNIPCPPSTVDAGNGMTYSIACGKYTQGTEWKTRVFASIEELDEWLQAHANALYEAGDGNYEWHLVGVWHLGRPVVVEIKVEEKSEPQRIEERKWNEYRAIIKAG